MSVLFLCNKIRFSRDKDTSQTLTSNREIVNAKLMYVCFLYNGFVQAIYCLPAGHILLQKFLCLLLLSKTSFSKKEIMNINQRVKHFGSRSGPTFCRA